VKHLRRTDELLRYAWHARNSEEHGIAESTKLQKLKILSIEGEGITMMPPDPGQAEDVVRIKVASKDGKGAIPKITSALPGLFLREVTDDRTNFTVQPPTMHLGKPWKSKRPREVSVALLTYLEALVAEAETLVK
jgi:hypothetical protein